MCFIVCLIDLLYVYLHITLIYLIMSKAVRNSLIAIPSELHAKIKELADKEDRSVVKQIIRMLREWMDEYGKKE